MRDELQASLKQRYPELYELQDETYPIKRWGIEVGDGWYAFIDAVLAIASCQCRESGEPIMLSDRKQKAGTLRIKFRGAVADRLRGAIDAALEFSARTCERCGGPKERCNPASNVSRAVGTLPKPQMNPASTLSLHS